MVKKDVEYMLTEVGGLECVLYFSNKLKDIAKFTKREYRDIKSYSSRKSIFLFEGKQVRIEKIDMGKDYE
jgi:hypothetical protein